ncbi:MAG: hypothetical protein GTN38_02785, partial [Candidatus Aenigmarchaeota archaeon]|nr:hypothetical protein [Candidatus Aenigmarchaeota archaeon]NIP40563.1 hypothetical protein [Candidatus Aenigmarchaeota archaeon]NIQ18408.1 hypothetical protein [Candidatus Aenigmarchaeota archaeon]
MARTGVKGGVIVSLFIIVFIFIFSGFAGSYVSINFPGDKNLGKFLSEEPLTADLNLTFDVPFPLGPDETMLTSKITYPDGRIYAEETIPLRPLLERYGVVYDGKYVYKPRFFDYDIRLTGKNVTYVGVPFSYTIQQTRVPPTDKGDRKWKVQGRHITDSTGTGAALLNTYCSGPWDFRDEGIGIGKLCDTSKTYCSAQPPNGNGDGECYVTCGAHLTQSSCEGEAQYDCNWVPGTGEEFCRIADITKCPILNGIETCSYTSEPLCEANAPCCGWAESGYCACADLPNGVCTAPEVSCPPSGRCCLPDNCCETAGANCADPNYCYCDGLGKVLAETYTRDDPTRPRAYCANMAFQSPGGTLTLRSNPNPGGAKIGIATGTCSENLATQTGTAPSGIICSYVPGGTHTCNNVPAGTLNAVVWHDDASDRATEIQVCQPTTGMAGE